MNFEQIGWIKVKRGQVKIDFEMIGWMETDFEKIGWVKVDFENLGCLRNLDRYLFM